MKINKTDALIVIDIQNDFCPGGALAVIDGDKIIPGVNELSDQFDTVIFTQDWHPENHASFAKNHDKEPFSSIELDYGEQTLWPNHCVQGSFGAEFHNDLSKELFNKTNAIIRKGTNPNIDSYSAFFENDKVTPTGLIGYLKERGIERVFFVGLAYDFCVAYSALDAKNNGFESIVIKDLTRAIKMPVDKTNTEELMDKELEKSGVRVIESNVLTMNKQPQIGI